MRSKSKLVGKIPSFVRDFVGFAGIARAATLLGLMLPGGLVEGLILTLLVPLLALLTGQSGGWTQELTFAVFAATDLTTPMASSCSRRDRSLQREIGAAGATASFNGDACAVRPDYIRARVQSK